MVSDSGYLVYVPVYSAICKGFVVLLKTNQLVNCYLD